MSCERRQFGLGRKYSVCTATSSDTRLLVRKPIGQGRHLSLVLTKAGVDLPPRVLARGFKISALSMGRERVLGFELTKPNLKSILEFVLTNPKPKKWGE